MMEPTLDVDISEVMASFDRLTSPAQRSVITAAKRAGAQPIRREAAKRAPIGQYSPNDRRVPDFRQPGKLKRSLRKSKTGLKVTRRNKNVFVVAGLSDEDPYYARWVETGHAIRSTRRGPAVGMVHGRHFMRKAGEVAGPASIRKFIDTFFDRTQKQINAGRTRPGRKHR